MSGSTVPRVLAGIGGGQSTMSLTEHVRLHGPMKVAGPAFVATVVESGLKGRGGAAFPTGRKLASVAGSRSLRGTVVVANGVEGEPASAKDRLLLVTKPHLVLDGIAAAVAAVGARRAILCVHDDALLTRRLERALSERHVARLDPIPVEVVTVPASYVSSEESALINWINRGRALPTTRPPRPDERGVDGRPTLVNNVETFAQMALIARHGSAWFSSVGARSEPGTILLSVSGAVASGGVLEIETGTSLSDVLSLCGGLTEPVSGYLVGGYFGGWLAPAVTSTLHLSPAAVQAAGGALGAGVVVAFPASACPLNETGRVLRWLAGESAGQCGPCTFGLPAISQSFDVLTRGGLTRSGRAQLDRWIGQVQGRGACHHPDGTARLVASALSVFRAEVDLHARGRCCAPRQQGHVLPLPERSAERLLATS